MRDFLLAFPKKCVMDCDNLLATLRKSDILLAIAV